MSGAPEGLRRPRRILLVDDNLNAAHALQILLQARGSEVRAVHDGAAALEMFGDFHPDVVFLDLGLPGMDGYEVARRIRERSDGRECALIALTGWGNPDDRRHAEAAGFSRHLVKPASIDAIEAALEELDR